MDIADGLDSMDATVRTSLKNLTGLLDEGFVTQAEYDQRRKIIIDAATGSSLVEKQPTKPASRSARGSSSGKACM